MKIVQKILYSCVDIFSAYSHTEEVKSTEVLFALTDSGVVTYSLCYGAEPEKGRMKSPA